MTRLQSLIFRISQFCFIDDVVDRIARDLKFDSRYSCFSTCCHQLAVKRKETAVTGTSTGYQDSKTLTNCTTF